MNANANARVTICIRVSTLELVLAQRGQYGDDSG